MDDIPANINLINFESARSNRAVDLLANVCDFNNSIARYKLAFVRGRVLELIDKARRWIKGIAKHRDQLCLIV